MSLKDKPLKLKKRIVPEYLQRMEEMAKSDDPLSYGALNNAIDILIESKQDAEKANQDMSERERYEKLSQEEKIQYWAHKHKTFTEQDVTPGAKSLAEYFRSNKSIDLDNMVNEFIKWYDRNMLSGPSDTREYHKKNLRNFIEKMAVWYELRYPKYEIDRLMHCCHTDQTNISEEMFIKNPYTDNMINGHHMPYSSGQLNASVLRTMEWDKFYNFEAFISGLPSSEQWFLANPQYPNYVYVIRSSDRAILYLTPDGTVKEADYCNLLPKEELSIDLNTVLQGKHISEIIECLSENGVVLPKENGVVEAIQQYQHQICQKGEMLNCVMYRIIERGGNRIGPRRAFLFAKEFDRDINIPMMYGINTSDPGLENFVDEYLKAGGSKELECYVNYFSRTSKYEALDTITVGELVESKQKKYSGSNNG